MSKKLKLTVLLQTLFIIGVGLSFVYQPPRTTVALVFFNSLLWPLTLSYLFIEILKKKKEQLQNNPMQAMNQMTEQLQQKMDDREKEE